MSDWSERVYNIFDSKGRIQQIEYALENINSSGLVVLTKSNDKIVVVAGKRIPEKLEIFEDEHIHKVSDNCYVAITGISSDIDLTVKNIRKHANALIDKYGRCTPDILCRSFSDKIQILTQESGTRPLAFSAVFFGFDQGPMLYNTDTSAICYPYKAIAIGEKSQRVNKFLENCENDAITAAIEGFLEASECSPKEMIVCYLEKNTQLKYLTPEELEPIINEISERK